MGKNGKWGDRGRKGTIGGKGIVEGRGMDGNGRQMKRWRGHSRRARRIRKGGGLKKEKKMGEGIDVTGSIIRRSILRGN